MAPASNAAHAAKDHAPIGARAQAPTAAMTAKNDASMASRRAPETGGQKVTSAAASQRRCPSATPNRFPTEGFASSPHAPAAPIQGDQCRGVRRRSSRSRGVEASGASSAGGGRGDDARSGSLGVAGGEDFSSIISTPSPRASARINVTPRFSCTHVDASSSVSPRRSSRSVRRRSR